MQNSESEDTHILETWSLPSLQWFCILQPYIQQNTGN